MKKSIPYGRSDFKAVLEENYYIDKTMFIPKLEEYGYFLYLIRPRRFGKSLFVNMLDLYYNVRWKNVWDLFKGLYIYDNPTKEKHSYYVMKFDFSAVSTEGNVNKNFNWYCNSQIKNFITTYNLELTLNEEKSTHFNLKEVFDYLRRDPTIKVYILIDEYDNFINNLLMNNRRLYEKMVSSQEAIYKEFFKLLKALTNENDSPLKRMFITGVSPLALFDVTSGSNIGKNITNEYMFNDIIGVTEEELEKLIDYYELDRELFNKEFLDNWYNNYKFNKNIKHTIYNTDMILYYVDKIILTGNPPEELVDINVRTDYSKLKFLVYTGKKLNGNFDALKDLFSKDYLLVNRIKDSFSAFELTKKINFISLLYYLGLLTIDRVEYGDIKLKIPNNTIRNVVAEFINEILEDMKFEVDISEFHEKMKELAFFGKLDVFYYIADKLNESTSIRDLVNQESDIKMFYMTYFSLNRLYAAIPEIEMNKGYADIFLIKAPNIEEKIPNILIEFKFLKQSEKFDDRLLKEAREQLKKYKNESKFKVDKSVIVIFKGFKIEYCNWED